MKLFLGGGGQHEHPPLSDLILHGWLWLTDGNIHLLRLPSVVFYLLGAWFLVQAARRMAGDRARTYTLILLLLWPYGFHLGRLAGWYSFTFLLIALLTPRLFEICRTPVAKELDAGSAVRVGAGRIRIILDGLLMGLFGPGSFVAIWARTADRGCCCWQPGLFLMVASIPIMRAFVTELRRGAVTGVHRLPAGDRRLQSLLLVCERVRCAVVLGAGDRGGGRDCGRAAAGIRLRRDPPARRFLLYFVDAAGRDDICCR